MIKWWPFKIPTRPTPRYVIVFYAKAGRLSVRDTETGIEHEFLTKETDDGN